ncbi:hypothetical protein MST22_12480 [Virgibacillus halodenitrificans]|nr:hypothetical protein [Virgibacillus halodenitrificans]
MENEVIHFTEEAPIDLRFRRTLSAGMASAASSATFRPGSSPHAIPAGVAALHSNQFVLNFYFGYLECSHERRKNMKTDMNETFKATIKSY